MMTESTSSGGGREGVPGAGHPGGAAASVQPGVRRARPGVSLALQAGGASKRMGIDKATAPFVGGATVLEWLRDRVAHLFGDVFVVANEPARFRSFGLPVVTDALAVRGSVVGIYTALLASPTERVLCLACDLPLVTPELLSALIEGSPGHQVYVPRHGPYLQPLCAVYSVTAVEAYEAFMASGGRRVDAVFTQLQTGYLDVDDGRFGDPDVLFLNTNTPEELALAREVAEKAAAARPATAGAAAARGEVAPPPAAAGAVASDALADLSPAISAFVTQAPFPVVSFVGKKKSGKTTALVGVVEELTRRGLRVAVVKHDSHGFDPDVPGTDSYRLRHAGAAVTGVSSPDLYMWIVRSTAEPSLLDLMSHVTEPVDLLITEGFKLQPAPKIEVSRRERSAELIASEDELVGIVSDQRFAAYSVPQLDMDDFSGIADLIERRIIGSWGDR